jgi:hypothetical protein
MMRQAAKDKQRKADALAAALKNSKGKEQVGLMVVGSGLVWEFACTCLCYCCLDGSKLSQCQGQSET